MSTPSTFDVQPYVWHNEDGTRTPGARILRSTGHYIFIPTADVFAVTTGLVEYLEFKSAQRRRRATADFRTPVRDTQEEER